MNPIDAALGGGAQNPIDAALTPTNITKTPAAKTATPYGDIIRSSAAMVGIPHDIAMRQVGAESGFNPGARSASGAVGLLQLMPATAKELSVDPRDPSQNVAGGMKYLARQYHAYGKSWVNALAAYNWGPGNVEAWLARGGNFKELPAETQAYIKKIVPDDASRAEKMAAQPSRVTPVRSHRELTRAVAKPGATMNPIDAALAGTPATPAPRAVAPSPQPSANAAPTAVPQASNPNPNSFQDPIADGFHGALHAIDVIAGHQDLPFIWHNALLRDQIEHKGAISGLEAMRDPNSHVSQAMKAWRTNPVAAMDEYGMGSTAQYKWVAEHGSGGEQAFAKFMLANPLASGVNTFATEMANPMAALEGGAAGKGLKTLSEAKWLKDMHVSERLAHGFGPMLAVAKRSGDQGVAWANSLFSGLAAPHKVLKVPSTQEHMTRVFGGLDADGQKDVVRLLDQPESFFDAVRAHKPGTPLTVGEQTFNEDHARRALALVDDQRGLDKQLVKAGLKKKSGIRANYFPMKNSYDRDPNGTIEELMHGQGMAGGSSSAAKVHQTYDAAFRDPSLAKDFLPAQNLLNYRETMLRKLAFEQIVERAPQALRIPPTYGLRGKIKTAPIIEQKVGDRTIKMRDLGGDKKPYAYAANAADFASPALRRGAMAPELIDFVANNKTLANFLKPGTNTTLQKIMPDKTAAVLSQFGRNLVGLSRQVVIANPYYHPTINLAGNDAAARGMHGLGGNQWETGGYAVNAAKALAQQAGLRNPEAFAKGAQQYHAWVDKALKAGALSEFGAGDSAFGRSRSKLTLPAKGWYDRADRMFTWLSDFNKERTFGSKGEESFAVNLFKDASTAFAARGMKQADADAKASLLTRQAFGDFHNLDADNPLAVANFFMPWRVGNWRFWSDVLVKKPQYVTGTTHAIRNDNLQTHPDEVNGPFGQNPFSIDRAQDMGLPGPLTIPFVGRDVSKLADMAGSLAPGDTFNPGAAASGAYGLATESLKPQYDLAKKAITSATGVFDSKDMAGPETSYAQLFNPKAPGTAQAKQILTGVLEEMPIPIVSLRDSLRRGFTADDIKTGVVGLLGGGYGKDAPLDDDQRAEVSRAKKLYLRAWQRYTFDDHDPGLEADAWKEYMDSLRDAGVIH